MLNIYFSFFVFYLKEFQRGRQIFHPLGHSRWPQWLELGWPGTRSLIQVFHLGKRAPEGGVAILHCSPRPLTES